MLKAYVDFRVPLSFVREVRACVDEIDGGIVRVTKDRQRDHMNHHCRHLFVVATAIHHDQVIRLRFGVGMTQGRDDDKEIEQRAEDFYAGLVKDLEDAGATVRGGIITALLPEAA